MNYSVNLSNISEVITEKCFKYRYGYYLSSNFEDLKYSIMKDSIIFLFNILVLKYILLVIIGLFRKWVYKYRGIDIYGLHKEIKIGKFLIDDIYYFTYIDSVLKYAIEFKIIYIGLMVLMTKGF